MIGGIALVRYAGAIVTGRIYRVHPTVIAIALGGSAARTCRASYINVPRQNLLRYLPPTE
jgi:hypothetical protein